MQSAVNHVQTFSSLISHSDQKRFSLTIFSKKKKNFHSLFYDDRIHLFQRALIFKSFFQFKGKLSDLTRKVNSYSRSIKKLMCKASDVHLPRKASDLINKIYNDFINNPETSVTVSKVTNLYKDIKIDSLNGRIEMLRTKRKKLMIKCVKLNNVIKGRRFDDDALRMKRSIVNKYRSYRLRRPERISVPVNSKAILNLTRYLIPSNVKWLLSLGPKFCPPGNVFDPSDLYYAVCTLANDVGSVSELNDLVEELYSSLSSMEKVPRLSNLHKFATKAYSDAKRFLKFNSDVFVMNSDKGQITILIHERDYLSKLDAFIKKNVDSGTYVLHGVDIFLSEYYHEQNVLNDSISCDFSIAQSEKENLIKALNNKSSTFPNFYVTIKAHKEGYPVRPIVSARHSHTSKLQGCLLHPLQSLVNEKFNARNSFEVKSEIVNLWVEDTYDFVTLDVVDMFTNIPVTLIYDIIRDQYHVLKLFTTIPLNLILALLKFALKFSNVFKYDGRIYIQGKGLPMGGKLSTVISCLIMDHLFKAAFKLFLFDDVLWFKKFVDDCIFLVKKSVINDLLEKCNAMHNDLKFTMSGSGDGSISYLDLSLSLIDNRVLTRWYKKPISSGRILNYLSNHPPKMIKNVVLQFLKRILSLSGDTSRDSVINEGIKLLRQNSYPRWYIENLLSIAMRETRS